MQSRGFTLIELMVVIAIMSALMGLVGPMVIDSVRKSQAKVEILTLKNWVERASIHAFISQQSLSLELVGKKAVLADKSGELINNQDFEHLFFQPQTIQINRSGIVKTKSFHYQLGDEKIMFNLY